MKQSKITLLTSVGAGLEYYDLVIYSLLANFISRQFFPAENHVASLFATFGVFAVGNILRPDRKSTRLNSSHTDISRMPSSA